MKSLLPSKEEYPLRPDGGKWIAFGNRYPLDFDFENYRFSKYCYGGERRSYEENFFGSKSVDLLQRNIRATDNSTNSITAVLAAVFVLSKASSLHFLPKGMSHTLIHYLCLNHCGTSYD